MATTARTTAPSHGGLKTLALLVGGGVALYFVYDSVLRYFVWSEASYGYYWPYRLPLVFHVAGGLVALLVGIFQLWSGLNGKSMSTHPVTGRLYATAVLVGALGGIVLSVTSAVYGFAWAVGLLSLALAWLVTTSTAIYCIRRRNIKAHREWMIRSYLVTFAFVTFRIVTDHVPYEALWGISRPDMSTAAIWAVWVLPLLAYQVYLQFRER